MAKTEYTLTFEEILKRLAAADKANGTDFEKELHATVDCEAKADDPPGRSMQAVMYGMARRNLTDWINADLSSWYAPAVPDFTPMWILENRQTRIEARAFAVVIRCMENHEAGHVQEGCGA